MRQKLRKCASQQGRPVSALCVAEMHHGKLEGNEKHKVCKKYANFTKSGEKFAKVGRNKFPEIVEKFTETKIYSQ